MNWLHFILWVAGIYGLYYLVNILIDVAGGLSAPAAESLSPELTFSETVQPVQLKHSAAGENTGNKTRLGESVPARKYEPEVIASGGVSLKDLFTLARQEAIIYTHPVGF
jgi:hypothetical protein